MHFGRGASHATAELHTMGTEKTKLCHTFTVGCKVSEMPSEDIEHIPTHAKRGCLGAMLTPKGFQSNRALTVVIRGWLLAHVNGLQPDIDYFCPVVVIQWRSLLPSYMPRLTFAGFPATTVYCGTSYRLHQFCT